MCLKYSFFYFLLFFKHSKYLKNLIDTYALNGSVQKKNVLYIFLFFWDISFTWFVCYFVTPQSLIW